MSLANKDFFQEQLKEAGFSDISFHEINHAWKLESHEEFLTLMRENPFFVDTANALNTTPQILAEYTTKTLQESYPTAPFEIKEMTASIAIARK